MILFSSLVFFPFPISLIKNLFSKEFGISPDSIDDNSCLWAIYECSVSHDGVIKQRRLPPTATNLAETVALNARLYLRDMQKV